LEYKVTKKFFNPLTKTRINVGEMVEVPEQYLEGFLPYITMEVKIEKIIPTIEEAKAAPPIKIVEKKVVSKTKKKVK